MPASSTARRYRLQDLNDLFRQTGPSARGQWLLTRGVLERGVEFAARAVMEVRRFNRFDASNDPHSEHDFGAFDLGGERLFWKIDYYDQTLTYGSNDPTDPSVTTRVLTLMLASEY